RSAGASRGFTLLYIGREGRKCRRRNVPSLQPARLREHRSRTMEDQNKSGPTIDHDPNDALKAKSTWSARNILLAAGAVVLVGGGVAVAQGGFGPHGMGHRMMGGFADHRFERMMDEIDATKEQEDRIWAIIDATRAELRPV